MHRQRYPPGNILYNQKSHISIIICLFEIFCHKSWFAVSSSSKLRQYCSESSDFQIPKRPMQTFYEEKKRLFVMTSGTSSRIVTWMSSATRVPNSPLKTMTRNLKPVLIVKGVLSCLLMKMRINCGLPSIYRIILFLTSKEMLYVIKLDSPALLFEMLFSLVHTCS